MVHAAPWVKPTIHTPVCCEFFFDSQQTPDELKNSLPGHISFVTGNVDEAAVHHSTFNLQKCSLHFCSPALDEQGSPLHVRICKPTLEVVFQLPQNVGSGVSC